MAQSVPTAHLGALHPRRAAAGLGASTTWTPATASPASGWTPTGTAQQAVEVRLQTSCDTDGTTEVPSDREGMRRLERVDRMSPTYAGERYYVFEGGCITVVFSLDSDSAGEALAVSSQVVGVIARDDLAAQVHEESGGRLVPRPAGNG